MSIQKAINLIDEHSEKTQNPAIKRIATYILDELLTTDENADKVLKNDKSLEKCWSFVSAKAKNKAVSGSAFIEDEVVFGWVREYYGITILQSTAPAVKNNTTLSLLDLL